MAKTSTAIKNRIGRLNPLHLFRGNPNPSTAQGGVTTVPASSYTRSSNDTTALSGMTTEELQQRRRGVLATVSFDVPRHRRVLNAAKNLWRILGPFCFVLFTAWEVFYFINSFMPPEGAWTNKALIWGITLLIEVPFMVATYDMSERKAVAAERRARGEPTRERDLVGALLLWLFLAAVNVAGQVSFLVLITRVGGNPFAGDSHTVGLWFFICIRVSGVLAGDAYTAFFLRPDDTTIDRILRAQEAQMRGEKALAESDADRLRMEAESNALVKRIQISVERDEREATFIADWQQMNMQQTLERQKQFMIAERSRMRELNGLDDAPNSGDL
jgi:hypothetical protein